MQSITSSAIYVKAPDFQSYLASIADIKSQIAANGCKLASQDCIYGDIKDGLAGLEVLVNQAQGHQFQVVYVDKSGLIRKDFELYQKLINRLYNRGVSILLV